MEGSPPNIPQFRTKTGRCLLTPDEIILERFGWRGRMAGVFFGQSPRRSLFLYGSIGFCALACGMVLLLQGHPEVGVYLLVIGTMFLLNAVLSRRLSATPSIQRSAIIAVEPHAPHAGMTRGYFVVRFQEKGQERKRLIILPGHLQGGDGEYQLALAAFHESGMIAQGDE